MLHFCHTHTSIKPSQIFGNFISFISSFMSQVCFVISSQPVQLIPVHPNNPSYSLKTECIKHVTLIPFNMILYSLMTRLSHSKLMCLCETDSIVGSGYSKCYFVVLLDDNSLLKICQLWFKLFINDGKNCIVFDMLLYYSTYSKVALYLCAVIMFMCI